MAEQAEGPYDPKRNEGIDSLIKTLIENDVARQGNVYAELGTTWRLLMRDPDSAAHSLGKLFKYMGSDKVLWGTDSIWYGSPQDQIEAFRTFQISKKFQEEYGYPAITDAMRAQVFGLNAAPLYGFIRRRHATTPRQRPGQQRPASLCTSGRPKLPHLRAKESP